LLYKSGCRKLIFGLESYNQRVLDSMKKGVELSWVDDTSEACMKLGIAMHFYLICGFPTETEAEVMDSINFVLNNQRLLDSPGFSAMQLGDREELFEHVKIIYDLMYKHYILGKKNDSTFPSYECCPSAQNLMVAGLGMGYPNASVLDSDHDHCYTAFPFLLGEEKGFIVADPTSDQLWHGSVRPRNHIFVAKHGDWEYKTNWASGHDLYPDNYINLDSLKKNKNNWCSYNSDIDGFFDRVFENPVSVSINKS